MKTAKRTRGSTLTEVSIAATLTMLVMSCGLAVFMFGMSGFYKGQGKLDAETTSATAVRRISYELREAMSVSVDSNGQGVTFQKAALDGSGNVSVPITWDNVSRRLALSGTDLQLTGDGVTRTICRNVITTDPTNSNAAYTIFVAGTGTVKRSLTITVVTQSTNPAYGVSTNRSRETIYFRNVPELTR